jgi:hypothetical protein
MRTFPDNGYRQYDERYTGQAAYKSKHDPLWNKVEQEKKASCFAAANFQLADDHNHCTCPASKRLYRNDRGHAPKGYIAIRLRAAAQDYVPASDVMNVCAYARKNTRAFLRDKQPSRKVSSTKFGSLPNNKRLNRSTLVASLR